MSARFSNLLTGLARFPAGLALSAIGSKGFAGLIHLHTGDAQAFWSAVTCLPLSLVFLVPSLARRVLHAGRHPDTKVWPGVAAAVVLFILTVASMAFTLGPAGPVFGLVPRWWLALAYPVYAFIFALAFIYPEMAYPPAPAPTQSQNAQAQTDDPAPQVFGTAAANP